MTACIASKRMRKPEANSARIASKSNSVRISAAYLATGSTISTLAPPMRDDAERVEIDVGRIDRLVGGDRFRAREDRVGDLLRRRAAVADVVFDAEIAVGAAGIVAGREDDAAIGAERADQAGDRGRRQEGRPCRRRCGRSRWRARCGWPSGSPRDCSSARRRRPPASCRRSLRANRRSTGRNSRHSSAAGTPALSCAGRRCRASGRA